MVSHCEEAGRVSHWRINVQKGNTNLNLHFTSQTLREEGSVYGVGGFVSVSALPLTG